MPLPVAGGRITAGFGPTDEPLDSGGFNKGLDIGVPVGTPVQAVVGGTVVQAGPGEDGWGTSVKIRDARGNVHNYGHLSGVNVQVGQEVQPGTPIGVSGNTGASTGPHLSYDVLGPNGAATDPSPWLGFNVAVDNRVANDLVGRDLGEVVSGAETSGGGAIDVTPSYYADPEVNSRYLQVRDRYLTAFDEWTAAGQPREGAVFDRYMDEWDAFLSFTDTFGNPSAQTSQQDPAQTAFENAVTLGDLELAEADRAYKRWYDQQEQARADAASVVTNARQHNIANAELEAARNQSQTPGLMPRPTDAGTIYRSYNDVLNQYLEERGLAGEPPPVRADTGISLPDLARDTEDGMPAGTTPAATPAQTMFDTDYPGPGAMLGPNSRVDMGRKPGGPGAQLPGRYNRMGGPPVRPEQDEQFVTDAMGAAWENFGNWATSPTRSLGAFGPVAGAAQWGASKTGLGKKAKEQAKKWWQRAFAEGGTNIPGGRGFVGERAPEIMEVPGFGSKIVGAQGPEEVDIPEGANIIPLDEAYYFSQIQRAAQERPARRGARDMAAAQQRAQDPQLQQKVVAAIQKAMASQAAADPPYTPRLGEDWPEGRDPWSAWRPLTGQPATQAEAEAAAQQQRGGRR